MKTIAEFLALAEEKFGPALEITYVFPSLYVVIVDDLFEGRDADIRETILMERLDLDIDEMAWLRSLGLVEILLLTKKERETEYAFLKESDQAGHHWLEWMGGLRGRALATARSRVKTPGPPPPRAVHFYGYKGGQARSTFLTLLAKYLADEGQHVLLVDADVEAPSLDTMLGLSAEIPEQTLMGLCGWANEVMPISRAYVGQRSSGTVDLIACRPRGEEFDIDFAAFALKASLDARTLQRAAEALSNFARDSTVGRYDIVLFDHRTGVTSSVLPVIYGWPGPAVIFVRPDGTTRLSDVRSIFNALLSHDESTAGVFVSFSLDPKETSQQARKVHGRFIDELLTLLSDALTFGTTIEDIDPAELEESWVFWHHDRALLGPQLPSPQDLSADNQRSLSQIVDVLGLREVAPPPVISDAPKLTRSGATDEGWFILTPDIARLFSASSSILYIFGRKGTGKTRLVRELQSQQLGEPLLVAADYPYGGLPSGSSAFQSLLAAARENLDGFWWALLRIGLESLTTADPTFLEKVAAIGTDPSVFSAYTSPNEVEKLVAALPQRRVFLIDGVETAVPASELRPFVESLFRFMATLQYNRALAPKLTVRLFLRSDLARGASQNVEQQIEGNEIQLRWDKPAILNFALGRIASLPWFNATFTSVCSEIQQNRELIARGALSEEAAENLLLRIFPKGLERNKLKTSTFLSTYFSDAGGDTEGKASFYPRLFDGFLRDIDAKASRSLASGQSAVEEGRLNSAFVLAAYDDASARFIDEVRTELYALLDFDPLMSRNQHAVDRLIDAFAGQKTPFGFDELVDTLSERANLPRDATREALHAMKSMGIFEDRPGYPGSWRTGRLYKSGLRMKYVR